MKLTDILSDELILEELGHRLTQRRLEQQLTQAELARQAGVSKRTVERIEAGSTTQFLTLIRILRILDLFDRLEDLIPEPQPRPMDLLKLKGKQRQRASGNRVKESDPIWVWGEDE